MDDPSLISAVDKLAIAGERAGFTVEQLIRLLNAGLTVDALLGIIAMRLTANDQFSASNAAQSSAARPNSPSAPN